ncbi:Crp/Fnr family transcriptional regulator [Flavilitoribacter nigricans]|uniref:Cyclic nucleotide-binding protein n=1 Tax=Flavilitoribacter nigricans (strain ATCC 23147 / DSM 23189 / NBRC 102662 / NCIMB 1420 / SS-2) TaxID=1122177 RepID=A0A2D0MZV0_FLAN2|nr:Crp/Fnr family transcriptional regulator [Flavilitoribacter nigricans]PHN01822.1 cyclic nucleotide-binding protein [Flavilitoribacter nigricans DSM 23189 = NBRC 102662]
MKIEPLISYLSKHLPLNEKEIVFLKTVVKEKKVRRRQFLLQEGDICKHNSFVVEGCLRMYMVDENGKEHNLQFAIENWWVIDMNSFYSDEPSRLNIEAMENSMILQINREDQFNLFVNYPKFNRIFRVLSENALIACQRRVMQNISSTAEERYLDFMDRYPFLFNRISNVQIASYLGITPEFLSTIRKRLAKS